MPFEKRECSPRDFADGRVHATFTIGPRSSEPNRMTLPFEVWWYTRDVSVAAAVINPTLDVTLVPTSGRHEDGLRLPILTGDTGNQGWVMTTNAVTWYPYASMSTEMVLALDAVRHPEAGLRAKIRAEAMILPLGPVRDQAGRAAPVAPFRWVWHEDFAIGNELWREWLAMMGHPRPRVFELHPLSFSDLSEFDLACSKLRDAERQFFLGHWGQAIALSRSVVEAVFRHLGYKGDRSYDWASIEAAGLPKEMAALFKAFNNVTNLENHPTGNHGWRRADARFALQTAAALAEYAGTLPQK